MRESELDSRGILRESCEGVQRWNQVNSVRDSDMGGGGLERDSVREGKDSVRGSDKD